MQRQRAFTLVEILVVMVISVVLASVTLLSIRDTDQDDLVRADMNRLAALLKRNCQDALVYGQHLGIRVADDGYDVYRYETASWTSIQGESALYHHRNWSGNWRLQLSFQDQDTMIDEADDTPQLICLGSGELLPFRFTLSDGQDTRLALSGQSDGRIRIGTGR